MEVLLIHPKAEVRKYLTYLSQIWGLEKENEDPIEQETWSPSPIEALRFLTNEGMEFIEFGSEDDSIIAIFDDGELKLTGYISYRGVYQAGAYDGEHQYFRSNMGTQFGPHCDGKWHLIDPKMGGCPAIAEDSWVEVLHALEDRIPYTEYIKEVEIKGVLIKIVMKDGSERVMENTALAEKGK